LEFDDVITSMWWTSVNELCVVHMFLHIYLQFIPKLRQTNQLKSGAFHVKAMFIDEAKKAWAWNWMFCPTYAGNYSILCWQYVHFLDNPEDRDSKLLLIEVFLCFLVSCKANARA
jgi:hypothetical protein